MSGNMPNESEDLSYQDFVRARKLHWQREAKSLGSDVILPRFDEVPFEEDDSSFMLYSSGPNGVVAVFEDAADTGWFYLYDANEQKILRCTHVYNRANVAVEADMVDIGWAADDSACGLAVWGQFRAFLGISSDLSQRKPVLSVDDNGIYASDWPPGFEHYLEKKLD
jgi:hypothetical protein